MSETKQTIARAIDNARNARGLVVTAQEVAAMNPLLAGSRIKELAIKAAQIARENAEIAQNMADQADDLEARIHGLEKQLQQRGILPS